MSKKPKEKGKGLCALCGNEISEIKLTGIGIGVGAKCEAKLERNGATWEPTTTKTQLIEMMRKRRIDHGPTIPTTSS